MSLMIAKGTVMSLILYALDVAFWKQIIIAVISATLTGVFLLIQQRQADKSLEEARKDREEIKQGLNQIHNKQTENDKT